MTDDRAKTVEWLFRTVVGLALAGAVSGGTFIVVAKVQLPGMEKRITENANEIQAIKAGDVGETPKMLRIHSEMSENTLRNISETMSKLLERQNESAVSQARVETSVQSIIEDVSDLKAEVRSLRENKQ